MAETAKPKITFVASATSPFWFGFEFAKGVMWIGIIGLLVAASFDFSLECLGWAHHDDTDPPHAHSGLHPYTDALSGCQYLGAGGSLTPRLGRDGHQICGAQQ